LEVGLVATDYIETTTTTEQAGILEDMPRLDYSGGASCPSLLLEGQRTNLISNSEYTDGTNWSNQGSIVDEENTSETASPEGVYNAVKLVSANATSEQWIQADNISVTSGNDCTISCFVQKSDYDYFHLRFTGVGGAFAAGSIWFNIANGTLGTAQSGITGTIKNYGNGWYRISATKSVVSTANASVRFQLASSDNQSSVVGDGSKGTYIYGCQAEEGSYPTSYIPTYGSGASVTRSADVCSKTGISSLIGQSEGTLFVEGTIVAEDSSANRRIISISDGSSANAIQIFNRFATNKLEADSNVGGVSQFSFQSGDVGFDTLFKFALAYKENDIAFYVNGTQIGTDSSASIPSTSKLAFSRGDDNFKHEGNINHAILFPTRLTNDELAELTTI
jgi:hypothetical protein